MLGREKRKVRQKMRGAGGSHGGVGAVTHLSGDHEMLVFIPLCCNLKDSRQSRRFMQKFELLTR